MLNKLGKAKVVADKTKYGVYVWEMPDGKWVGDDEGHYMLIPSVFGDAEKIKILKKIDDKKSCKNMDKRKLFIFVVFVEYSL